ncbi:unnamed protein product [Clonostachys rosea f. rosea IK726]|uniref:Uncharacterized protein n=4 Tax=Clonostachys rosea f. rosea IK726 TaxID=1349383 RepID=A0ACA9UEG7_BIOOC|nr:unnamed protein product [Clonostachys rosea f. rosea IK726]CAG9951419.1 unnamed protein product [Clonostachys rosea f. rosea IK726]CAG9957255.1 unnamed protein product [Clonostachys rosea f. rosea IK726]
MPAKKTPRAAKAAPTHDESDHERCNPSQLPVNVLRSGAKAPSSPKRRSDEELHSPPKRTRNTSPIVGGHGSVLNSFFNAEQRENIQKDPELRALLQVQVDPDGIIRSTVGGTGHLLPKTHDTTRQLFGSSDTGSPSRTRDISPAQSPVIREKGSKASKPYAAPEPIAEDSEESDYQEYEPPATPAKTRPAPPGESPIEDDADSDVEIVAENPAPVSKTPSKPSAKAKGKQRDGSEAPGRPLPNLGEPREYWCRRCAYVYVFGSSTGGCFNNLHGGKRCSSCADSDTCMSLDEWTQGWLDEYQDAKREGDAARVARIRALLRPFLQKKRDPVDRFRALGKVLAEEMLASARATTMELLKEHGLLPAAPVRASPQDENEEEDEQDEEMHEGI